jgi:hypothetical protein
MGMVEDPPAGPVPATSVTTEELKALLLRMGYVDVEVESRPDLRDIPLRWAYGMGVLPG